MLLKPYLSQLVTSIPNMEDFFSHLKSQSSKPSSARSAFQITVYYRNRSLHLDSGYSRLFHPPLNPLPSREGKSKERDLLSGSARNDGSGRARARLYQSPITKFSISSSPCLRVSVSDGFTSHALTPIPFFPSYILAS